MSFDVKFELSIVVPILVSIASHAVVLLGCEGIGRPLVDEYTVTDLQCTEAPSCDDGFLRLNSLSVSSSDDPSEMSGCGHTTQSCPSITSDTGAISDSRNGCELSLDIEKLSTTAEPLPRFECARINLVNDDPYHVSPVRLQNLDLERSVFVIFSQTPFVVELENASLSGVSFSLRGDITLKIDRSVIFDGVTISSESEAERLPTLELIEIHGQRLFVGNGSKAFNGSFRATRSELENCRILARDVQFESVRIDRATIDTTIMTGTDASLLDTAVGFQHAVLSASLLYRVEVPRCESLTTISSTIETTRISACNGSSYRAYSTDMIDVSLNGSIEIDKGYWEKVRFGSQQSTFVVGWDFELNAATFCEKSRSFRMGDSSTISCSRCETEFLHEPGAVCLLPGTNPIIAEQNCAVFVQPGDCPEPVPSRTRP